MAQRTPVINYVLIAVLTVLFILYGSLYPFAFHHRPPGALPALLATWARRPERGDAIANVLLYMPLGYFAFLSIPAAAGRTARFVIAVMLGLLLSLGVELIQYYDAGRDSEMADVYTNTLGTVLGAGAALVMGGTYWKKLPWPSRGDPAALMLLTAWAGYNLFPFAPVIDLHKYWDAVKPVLLHPSVTPFEIFTHAAAWIAAAVLVNAATGGRRGTFWYAAYAALLLGGKIVIMGGALSVAHLAGAAAGLVWAMMTAVRPRPLAILAAVLLLASVVALRLEPFHFQPRTGQFGWIPFASFMRGSIQVNTLSFLEKFFLYGSLIWLLNASGLRQQRAAFAVALLLLATSWADLYLPGRSAEITDAVTALLAGGLIALVQPQRRRSTAGKASPSRAAT